MHLPSHPFLLDGERDIVMAPTYLAVLASGDHRIVVGKLNGKGPKEAYVDT